MKIIFFSFVLILTFSSCSHRNAFDSFALTPREKLAEDSVLNSKISKKEKKIIFIYTSNFSKIISY